MSTAEESQQPAGVPPRTALLQMSTAYWVSQALGVAAELGIADLLKDGPKSSQELATATGTHQQSLYRLLRVLVSVGVFSEEKEDRFGLTPLSVYLQTGVPGSMRAVMISRGAPWSWAAWGALRHSIKTGRPAWEHAHGLSQFAYYAQNPQAAEIFDKAMGALTVEMHSAALALYDFAPYKTVVDVGGGQGALLTAILNAYPRLRGILFDRPHVMERAMSRLAASGLAQRCSAQGGDFFEAVPAGGDLYMLAHVVIDWDDARAATLLKSIHKAMPEDGKLLILEEIIPQGSGPSWEKLLDLNMLVVGGGRGRTESELRSLLGQAGFTLLRILRAQSPVSLIEAERG